ncbi:MAG: sigma-70 family RNA polymerase sigma factor [Myxococcales bacterium]|nr:sigma-70 family RNA polymerase sigma factor [Myxococcales bacterium]
MDATGVQGSVQAFGDEDAREMQAVANGDKAAFTRLFDRHQASVVRFCRRFVADEARAEELAQDVFVKLFRAAKSYQPSARFKTFLFRVATNACLNDLRRPAAKAEVLEAKVRDDDGLSVLEEGADAATPLHALEAKEVEAAVQRAFGKMSDRERAAFAMCRFEGLAYRDIAEALTSTESAVKSLIHRATVQVMKHLAAMAPEGSAV